MLTVEIPNVFKMDPLSKETIDDILKLTPKKYIGYAIKLCDE